MMAAWFIGLALYVTLILAVIVVLLMRILSLLEIVVRAIPLGSARIQERRTPIPVSGTHRRDTQEV
jgi:hypothetical protein